MYSEEARRANLSGADLREADLHDADLSWANLSNANLRGADLQRTNFHRAELLEVDLTEAGLVRAYLNEATLTKAHLQAASLYGADLTGAGLSEADLRGADLARTDLTGTQLYEANLSGADLSGALLIGTHLEKADLTGCLIHGISVWDVHLEGTLQSNLIIDSSPMITVDNLKVAQFIHLLLNNQEIRDIIDTITSKVVLILGRFTEERKQVLDALREELRKRDYLPVLFDFEKPGSRDITETVSLLARMARFVIADLTDAKSVPQELYTIIPDLPSVPVQPILLATEREYSMFEHFKRYPWVLKDYYYISVDDLLPGLKEHIIDPAEQKVQELKRPQ